MKRVLVLNYEFPPLGGGASPVSFELAKRLSETGAYDLDVITMGYAGLPAYEELTPCLRVYRAKCLRSKKELSHPWEQATYLVSAYALCKKLLIEKRYDICHTHFIIPTGVLALRLKKKFGLPYIITAHGSDVLGYNKRFRKIYPLIEGSWRRVLDGAKIVISPSAFLKTEILRAYPNFAPNRIQVVPNGIDTTKFSPQPKKPYLFSSGRLLPNKGFQHLIRAVSEKDLCWEVHIAGDGPMRGELEAFARLSKTKIIFHGWLDNNGKEYKDLLEQAAIYVLASEKENASVALLEAMAAGCAIITTHASGTGEMVGASGILVPFASVDRLADAINQVVEDTKQAQQYQQAAREKAESMYSYAITVNEYASRL